MRAHLGWWSLAASKELRADFAPPGSLSGGKCRPWRQSSAPRDDAADFFFCLPFILRFCVQPFTVFDGLLYVLSIFFARAFIFLFVLLALLSSRSLVSSSE